MVDLLQTGNAWLQSQRKQFMSHPVTYTRGLYSVNVSATVGQTIFRLSDDYGAAIRTVSRDYLITAGDLVLNGSSVTPEQGDEIVEIIDGKMVTHEVMGPGGDEPDWRYSDADQLTFRIHTKEVNRS